MTRSVWNEFPLPKFQGLKDNLETDVCVIGTGIAGLTTALLLMRHGKKVIVLGDGELVSGESCRTTAQINTAHDDGWYEMEKIHGKERIQLCYQSYRAATDLIEDNIKSLDIKCGFEYLSSYLFSHKGSDGREDLENELASALAAGLPEVELIARAPLKMFETGAALRFGKQAQFHPTAYLAGLARVISNDPKGRIFTHSRVSEINSSDERVCVQLEYGSAVTAAQVVLATNVPFHHRLIPHDAMAAYRSYVVALPIKRDSIERAQYWDTLDPYHYVRLGGAAFEGSEHDILIVGGEDHRVGDVEDEEQRHARLVDWAIQRFPVEKQIISAWSGQTIETFDGMPLIGESAGEKDRVFIITGDSGTGMTHGTVGGMVVSDLIVHGMNPWHELYNPSRARTKSLKRWLGENISSVLQYRKWLTPGELDSVDEIPLKCGAIIRKGLKKIAAYKDGSGKVSQFSATCPHMAAILTWNDLEHSWDCPAHGSRFSPCGEVLNGPAACGLKVLEEDDTA